MSESEEPPKAGRKRRFITVKTAKRKLAKFLERNPSCQLSEAEEDLRRAVRVDSPWGDPTMSIVLQIIGNKGIAALNELILPEPFSAIWHTDTNDLEVAWTVYPLADDVAQIMGRKFAFSYNNQTYECEFGKSSGRLISIAAGMVPKTSASSTIYRNMESFFRYAHRDKMGEEGLETPKSFWIRNAKLSQPALVEMVRHLNFFLTYYDSKSPIVLIHDVDRSSKLNEKIRHCYGPFPPAIASRQLDENLLIFWSTARTGNPMLRFILYYRIIEYAAFHYMDAGIRAKVKRILANPAVGLEMDQAIQDILLAIDPKKGEDVPRFNALLIAAVKPASVWKEIANNREFFSKPVKFDGGFELDEVTSKGETEKTFESGGLIKAADGLRRIRNVLSHGRDQNTSTAITPTARNFRILQPWVNLAAVMAGEVVLYEGVS